MPINPLRGDKVLRIEYQNSFFDKPVALGTALQKIESSGSFWNFFREGSNHAYLSNGTINYEGICENNLIISSREINLLNDVKNSFIFSIGQYGETAPISDFERIKKIGLKILTENKIKYNVPLAVKKREELFDHGLNKIKAIIKNSYGINPSRINLISSGRTKFGKYFISDIDGKEYIFKYKGTNKKEIESNSKIIFKLDSYFPKIHERIDDPSFYAINMGDGLYGLEDFVRKDSMKERDLHYIDKVGKTIALLHNSLNNSFGNKISHLEVSKRGEDFSESNLASMYLDITKYCFKSNLFIPFLKELINRDLSSRMRGLPDRIINGDVNSSNVLDGESNLIIIDSETFGLDKKLKEFISPLLLKGENSEPKYIDGGLPRIIEQYNKYSQEPLSKEEISILPSLVQAATLKYYVVRNIRRGHEKGKGLQGIMENLEGIRRDSNVY